MQFKPYWSAAHVWDVLFRFYFQFEQTVSTAAYIVPFFFLTLVHAVHFWAAISSAAHVLPPDSRACALLGAMSL